MMYGLIGEKLGHSYSKIIHDKLGAYEYNLFPVSMGELDKLLKLRNFSGLNVTIPYKQTVMPYCDYISPLAKEIGAVNTLYFDDENRLCGTNTDYYGFIYAMKNSHIDVHNKKILILGDGATCKTIRKAVLDMGANEIIIASRKAKEPTFEHFKSDTEISPFEFINCTTMSYEDLTAQSDIQIVINTTPVGMYPKNDGRPIDLRTFSKCCGVFDVVYNPYYTQFILQAKELGIPYASGLAMLVAQATIAAKYFTGAFENTPASTDYAKSSSDFSSENQRIISELKATIAQC